MKSTSTTPKFFSSYNPPPSLSEVKCPLVLQDYIFDKSTHKLTKTDKIPFYEEIQSHYESTKLSDKLIRYTMGDITALGEPNDSYIDVSGLSTNLAQVLNTKQIAESEFNKLPSDIKQLFRGNYAEFVGSIEDGTFEKRLVDYAKSKSGTNGGDSGADGGAPENDGSNAS